MGHNYLLKWLQRFNGELYGLKHARHGRQLWGTCKVRKNHTCVITGRLIKKGTQAFRPLTNKGNRYERIAAKVFIEKF